MARRLISLAGKVVRKSAGDLDADRYLYLSLDQAEPNPGNPDSDNSLFFSNADGTRGFTKRPKVNGLAFGDGKLPEAGADDDYALILNTNPTVAGDDSVGFRKLGDLAFTNESEITLQSVTETGNTTTEGIVVNALPGGGSFSGNNSNTYGVEINGFTGQSPQQALFIGDGTNSLIEGDLQITGAFNINTTDGDVSGPGIVGLNSIQLLVMDSANAPIPYKIGKRDFNFTAFDPPTLREVTEFTIASGDAASTFTSGATTPNGIRAKFFKSDTLQNRTSNDAGGILDGSVQQYRKALVVDTTADSIGYRNLTELALFDSSTTAINVPQIFVKDPGVGDISQISNTIPLVFQDSVTKEYKILDINVVNLDETFETLHSVSGRTETGFDQGETGNPVIFSNTVKLRGNTGDQALASKTSNTVIVADYGLTNDSAFVGVRLAEDIAFNDSLINLNFVLSRGDSTNLAANLGGPVRLINNDSKGFISGQPTVVAIRSNDSVGFVTLDQIAFTGEETYGLFETVELNDSADKPIKVGGLVIRPTSARSGTEAIAIDSDLLGSSNTVNQFLVYEKTLGSSTPGKVILRELDNNVLDGDDTTLQTATERGRTTTLEIIAQGFVGDSATVQNLEATTQATLASASVTDLTTDRVVFSGAAGELEDDANLTFDGTSLQVGVNLNVDGITTLDSTSIVGTLDVEGVTNLDSTSIVGTLDVDGITTLDSTSIVGGFDVTGETTLDKTTIDGLLDANAGIDASSVKVEDLTSGRVVIAGTNGELEDDADLTFSNTTLTATNINVTTDLDVGGITTLDSTSIVGTLDVDGITTLDSTTIVGAVNLTGLIGTESLEVLTIDGSNEVARRTVESTAFTGETLTTVTDPTRPVGYDVTSTPLYLNGGISLAANATDTQATYKLLNLGSGVSGDSVEFLEVDASILDGSALGLNEVLTVGNTSNLDILLGGTSAITADSATFASNLSVGTQATLASAAVSDLTDNRVVIAGTSGELEDDANFTFDGTILNLVADFDVSGISTFDSVTVRKDLVVLGNLRVDGATTVINSTELSVDDKNITLADGATQPSDANGGGITLNLGTGGAATLLYSNTNDDWTFNKSIHTDSDLDVGNNLTVVGSTTLDSTTIDATNAGLVVTGLSDQGTEFTIVTIAADGTVGTREASASAFSNPDLQNVTDEGYVTTRPIVALGFSGDSATLGTAKVSDLTATRIVLAGTDGELEDNGSLTYSNDRLNTNRANIGAGGLTVGTTNLSDAVSDNTLILGLTALDSVVDRTLGNILDIATLQYVTDHGASTDNKLTLTGGLRLSPAFNVDDQLTLLGLVGDSVVSTVVETTAHTPLNYFTIDKASETGADTLSRRLDVTNAIDLDGGFTAALTNPGTPAGQFDVIRLADAGGTDSAFRVTLQSGATKPLEDFTWEFVLNNGDSTGAEDVYIRNQFYLNRSSLPTSSPFDTSLVVPVFNPTKLTTFDSVGTRTLGNAANQNTDFWTLQVVTDNSNQTIGTEAFATTTRSLKIDGLIIDGIKDFSTLPAKYNPAGDGNALFLGPQDSVGYRDVGAFAFKDTTTLQEVTTAVSGGDSTTASITTHGLTIRNADAFYVKQDFGSWPSIADVDDAVMWDVNTEQLTVRNLAPSAFEVPSLQDVTTAGDSTNIRSVFAGGIDFDLENTNGLPIITEQNVIDNGVGYYNMLLVQTGGAESGVVKRGSQGVVSRLTERDTLRSVTDRGASLSAVGADSARVPLIFSNYHIKFTGLQDSETRDTLVAINPSTGQISRRSVSSINANDTLSAVTGRGNKTALRLGTTGIELQRGAFAGATDTTDDLADYDLVLSTVGGVNNSTLLSVDRGQFDSDLNVDGITTLDSTTIDGKLLVKVGNTFPQTEDRLYIGGSGLDGEDASIYLGNHGDGTGYGWRFFYQGTGSANLNKLIIRSENLGSPVDALTFTQDGVATFDSTIIASGGIEGLTLANGGISGTNFDISGVNELVIADPGEGIRFSNNASGDITLAVVDDASDNILAVTGGDDTIFQTPNLNVIGITTLDSTAIDAGVNGDGLTIPNLGTEIANTDVLTINGDVVSKTAFSDLYQVPTLQLVTDEGRVTTEEIQALGFIGDSASIFYHVQIDPEDGYQLNLGNGFRTFETRGFPTNSPVTPRTALTGTGADQASFAITRTSADEFPPYFILGKSRGTDNNTLNDVRVNSGDELGRIVFTGIDQTGAVGNYFPGVDIRAVVNGAPGDEDMYSDLIVMQHNAFGDQERLLVGQGGLTLYDYGYPLTGSLSTLTLNHRSVSGTRSQQLAFKAGNSIDSDAGVEMSVVKSIARVRTNGSEEADFEISTVIGGTLERKLHIDADQSGEKVMDVENVDALKLTTGVEFRDAAGTNLVIYDSAGAVLWGNV